MFCFQSAVCVVEWSSLLDVDSERYSRCSPGSGLYSRDDTMARLNVVEDRLSDE